MKLFRRGFELRGRKSLGSDQVGDFPLPPVFRENNFPRTVHVVEIYKQASTYIVPRIDTGNQIHTIAHARIFNDTNISTKSCEHNPLSNQIGKARFERPVAIDGLLDALLNRRSACKDPHARSENYNYNYNLFDELPKGTLCLDLENVMLAQRLLREKARFCASATW